MLNILLILQIFAINITNAVLAGKVLNNGLSLVFSGIYPFIFSLFSYLSSKFNYKINKINYLLSTLLFIIFYGIFMYSTTWYITIIFLALGALSFGLQTKIILNIDSKMYWYLQPIFFGLGRLFGGIVGFNNYHYTFITQAVVSIISLVIALSISNKKLNTVTIHVSKPYKELLLSKFEIIILLILETSIITDYNYILSIDFHQKAFITGSCVLLFNSLFVISRHSKLHSFIFRNRLTFYILIFIMLVLNTFLNSIYLNIINIIFLPFLISLLLSNVFKLHTKTLRWISWVVQITSGLIFVLNPMFILYFFTILLSILVIYHFINYKNSI